MPARTTRKDARERVLKAFSAELDRLIPADESVPLRGGTFLDFENQVEALIRTVAPTLLEERADLEANAVAETAGRCPHCSSARTYLKKDACNAELRSPHGRVVVNKQHARCRACGLAFSPSGA